MTTTHSQAVGGREEVSVGDDARSAPRIVAVDEQHGHETVPRPRVRHRLDAADDPRQRHRRLDGWRSARDVAVARRRNTCRRRTCRTHTRADDALQESRTVAYSRVVSCSKTVSVITKFHYTGPTGPDRTRRDFFCGPGLRETPLGPCGSLTKSVRVRSGPCSGILP